MAGKLEFIDNVKCIAHLSSTLVGNLAEGIQIRL